MIDTLVKDVEKEMQEAALEDKDARATMKFMIDAGNKLAEDSKRSASSAAGRF